MNLCDGCGEDFHSVSAFDSHRYGPHGARRCRTVAEMEALGYSRDAYGRWMRPMRTVAWRRTK